MSKRDVPGNAIASAAMFDRQMAQIGIALLRFEKCIERLDGEGMFLTGMTVRLKDESRTEHMIVLKAVNEEGAFVAFQSSDTLAEALRQLIARLENGTIKWREDRYANGK